MESNDRPEIADRGGGGGGGDIGHPWPPLQEATKENTMSNEANSFDFVKTPNWKLDM